MPLTVRWLDGADEKSRMYLLLESLEQHLHMSQTWLVAGDSPNENCDNRQSIGLYDPPTKHQTNPGFTRLLICGMIPSGWIVILHELEDNSDHMAIDVIISLAELQFINY